ncbi:hypothetical protein HPB49_003154 [Dermacentor silvarum]|uniref:Uncharacterized protein n=1 Tax=Dermacentor silvarum TaxID=543639 RepID=A0ACB8DSS8_DERSI|nr:hypothetical protein HPB49_003154 [Dermacentor silvarum]
MLVFIEYEVDMTTAVVTHTAVQNFNPQNVADFDPIVPYDVWWNGDETTAGGYYKARVLHMAETEEDMALHTSKRLRKPVVSLEKGKKRTKGKPTQAAKQLRLQVQQGVEAELLSQIGVSGTAEHVQKCTCCEQGCAVQAELGQHKQERKELMAQLEQLKQDAAEEAGRLHEKILELEAKNSRLQDCLTSKVFATETEEDMALHTSKRLRKPVVSLEKGKKRTKGKPTQAAKQLRVQVQQGVEAELLSQIGVSGTAEHVQKCTCCEQGCAVQAELGQHKQERKELMAQLEQLKQDAAEEAGRLHEKILELEAKNSRLQDCLTSKVFATVDMDMSTGEAMDVVIGSSRDDGKVYAGSGQWIDKAAWGTLFRATSDSMFCRMASTMYWTPDELKNRSVTGTLSNKSRSMGKTEARPALTPEKLSSLKSI